MLTSFLGRKSYISRVNSASDRCSCRLPARAAARHSMGCWNVRRIVTPKAKNPTLFENYSQYTRMDLFGINGGASLIYWAWVRLTYLGR